jgi:hypothetical protein
MSSAPESKKPLLFLAFVAIVLLVSGGIVIGGVVWLVHRGANQTKPPVTKRGTPPGTPPGQNQRFEMDYPEKADKESVVRSGRAPRDTSAQSSRTPDLPAANDPFPNGKFPAEYNPNGLFRKLEKEGIISVEFQPNGTFLLEGTIPLNTPNERESTAKTPSDGTFRIEGTNLALKFNNGETKDLNIKPFDVFRDRCQSLLIDGQIFYRIENK